MTDFSCLDNSGKGNSGFGTFSPLCKARRGFCKDVSCFCTGLFIGNCTPNLVSDHVNNHFHTSSGISVRLGCRCFAATIGLPSLGGSLNSRISCRVGLSIVGSMGLSTKCSFVHNAGAVSMIGNNGRGD